MIHKKNIMNSIKSYCKSVLEYMNNDKRSLTDIFPNFFLCTHFTYTKIIGNSLKIFICRRLDHVRTIHISGQYYYIVQ